MKIDPPTTAIRKFLLASSSQFAQLYVRIIQDLLTPYDCISIFCLMTLQTAKLLSNRILDCLSFFKARKPHSVLAATHHMYVPCNRVGEIAVMGLKDCLHDFMRNAKSYSAQGRSR